MAEEKPVPCVVLKTLFINNVLHVAGEVAYALLSELGVKEISPETTPGLRLAGKDEVIAAAAATGTQLISDGANKLVLPGAAPAKVVTQG